MMKRITMVLLTVSIAVSSVFAGGAQEEASAHGETG